MRILAAIVFFVLSSALIACGASTCEKYVSPQTELITERYAVNLLRRATGETGEPSCLEIRKDGVPVFSREGFHFRVDSLSDTDTPGIAAADITGDGQANLIVSEYTGGAHCCLLLHIFELEPTFRQVQSIDAKHSELVHFRNLDEDPALELRMHDWTFAYWHTSFAESPAPEVILKYDGRKYVMSPDLMRKPSPGTRELKALAVAVRSSPEWHENPRRVPVRLWAEMLDLIYTGNMSQAWTLVDASWPGGVTGKREFLEAFKAQLETSPFWKDIRILNKD